MLRPVAKNRENRPEKKFNWGKFLFAPERRSLPIVFCIDPLRTTRCSTVSQQLDSIAGMLHHTAYVLGFVLLELNVPFALFNQLVWVSLTVFFAQYLV